MLFGQLFDGVVGLLVLFTLVFTVGMGLYALFVLKSKTK